MKKINLILFAIFFIVSCGHNESNDNSRIITKFPIKLKSYTVNSKKVPIYEEIAGTINAKTKTVISSKVTGNIKQINAEEGSNISEGTVLVIIDDREINEKSNQTKASHESAKKSLEEIETSIKQAKAKKQQAQSSLKLASTNYARYEQLLKTGVVSQQDFDTAKAKLTSSEAEATMADEEISRLSSKKEQIAASINQAKSAVEEANIFISYTKINAPFDCVVVKKHAEVGTLATPGMPLLTLENPNIFNLEVEVREKEFNQKAEVGCKVQVKVEALKDDLIDGTVAEIVPIVNPMSRTFKIKIAMPTLKGIKSGMYGKAMCPKDERESLFVPISALIKRGQLEQIFAIDKDNIVHLKLVKTGKKIGKEIEISAGLANGERVIMDPRPELQDSNKVEVE